MCTVTIVIIAPSPLVQLAMIAGCSEAQLWRFPVVDPQHYLACCSERMRAISPEPAREPAS